MVHAERDHAWVHGYLLPELGLPEGSVATIGSAGAYLWEVGDPSTVPVLAGALAGTDR